MSTQQINNHFTRVLAEFRNGQSISELSAALQTAVASARETGKPAKLIYTIKIVPGQSEDGAVAILDEIKTKIPEPTRKTGIFFADDDNVLHRDNPRQREMKFEEVKSEPQEVVDIAAQVAQK